MLARFVSFALFLVASANASVYVTNPAQTTICIVGQPCQVQWVDNGETPLLRDIGECEVGLYNGKFELIQSLPSVDVATTNTFTFKPDLTIVSGEYCIVFSAEQINYRSFSGSFTVAQIPVIGVPAAQEGDKGP